MVERMASSPESKPLSSRVLERTEVIPATDLSIGDSSHAKFNPEEFAVYKPFSEVPFDTDWRENLKADDLHVAEHELGHAFVAYKRGISVKLASIVPNYAKGYRGITILETSPNAYDMMVVSAAGSVRSHQGNGSDRMAHDLSRPQHNNKSFGDSLTEARSVIASLTPDEWRIMVQLFAYKREITGADIPEMLRRARYELDRGMTSDEAMFKDTVNSVNHYVESIAPVIIIDEYVEEELEDGYIRKYVKRNGEIQPGSEKMLCGACGVEDGHRVNCASVKTGAMVFARKPRRI